MRTLRVLPSCILVLSALPAIFAASTPASTPIDAVVSRAAKVESGQSLLPFRQLEEWSRQSQTNRVLRTQLEGGFIRMLEPTATFEARRFACKQLGSMGSEAALPALGTLLTKEDTVGIACLALTTYPPGRADEVLRSALASASGMVRMQLVRTLGDRRDPKAVDLLAACVRDPDPAIASAAISALGNIGVRAGWHTIGILRQTAKPELQSAFSDATLRCAGSLAAAGDRKTAAGIYDSLLATSEPDYIRRGAFVAIIHLDPDQGERRVLTAVRGSDPVLKPVAIAAVSSLGSATASQTFAAELPKLQPKEQVWLIDSLAARNDAAARTAIAKSLASPQSEVRRAALAALGRIGDAHTVALVVPMLRDSKDPEQNRAVQATLCNLPGGTRTDDAVRRELKHSSGPTRALLVTVLSQRQGESANPWLLQETANPDPIVAKAAFRALARTAGAADVHSLLEKLTAVHDPDARAEAENAASQALARIDNPSLRSTLVRGALSPANSVDARCSLLGLLPACGDAESLAALKAAASDSDARVRAVAVHSLAEWPDRAAWEPLVAVYRQPENESLRGTALRGLVRIASDENAHADSRLAERYMELLRGARGDADLKLILGALGGAAQPEALQLALPLLSNAGVHAEAEVAVKKIAEAIKTKYPVAANEALDKLKPQ